VGIGGARWALGKTEPKHYADRLFENGNGPKPSRQKQPNAYGLYDILGNVYQWMADWYGEKYYEVSENRDPAGPPDGTSRVVRGGTWYYGPGTIRVSNRAGFEPRGFVNVGFRCVGK